MKKFRVIEKDCYYNFRGIMKYLCHGYYLRTDNSTIINMNEQGLIFKNGKECDNMEYHNIMEIFRYGKMITILEEDKWYERIPDEGTWCYVNDGIICKIHKRISTIGGYRFMDCVGNLWEIAIPIDESNKDMLDRIGTIVKD